MPACARREIVLAGEVGVYHIWTRCVRRAFLCGVDPVTGRNFDHRRDWIRAYLPRLCQLFAIDAGFHVEMSNHLHLILRTRPDVVDSWSDQDVVRKWLTICRLVRSRDGQTIRSVTEGEIAVELARPGRVARLRQNLSSVSELMKALCEHISRRANAEDHVRGAFFEERFSCRRLENEAAILVCGIYIDLNQIRAGEAFTPEESTRTSAYDRICGRQQRQRQAQQQKLHVDEQQPSPAEQQPSQQVAKAGLQVAAAEAVPVDSWLCELSIDQRAAAYQAAAPSATPWRASDKGLLPITLDQYLDLLDWTGRQVHAGKKGAIPQHFAPILERLGIHRGLWLDLVTKFDKLFTRIVGTSQQLVDRAAAAGRRCYRGRATCAAAFG